MARVTVEDCINVEPNRFSLIVMAAQRARQIANGADVLVEEETGRRLGITEKRLRVRLTASGGARNPRVPLCTLRFLRSGSHRQAPDRYASQRFQVHSRFII